jgi:NADPH2:quinone reductase
MKAIELADYGGFDSLRLIDTEQPNPTANEILIQVKAAGVNFAELELTKGDYKIPKTPPFIMGFEAAGVVVEVGSQVQHVQVGDRVTSIVTSGGYAEYATEKIQLFTNTSFALTEARAAFEPWTDARLLARSCSFPE